MYSCSYKYNHPFLGEITHKTHEAKQQWSAVFREKLTPETKITGD